MFYNDEDFLDGMNRIFVVLQSYQVLILAFVLMDTHFHFILYGDLVECTRFMRDYLKRTSQHIAEVHGENKKLLSVSLSHQVIDNDRYLKTAICYVLRNPTMAGIQVLPFNYPWSSAALYFAQKQGWTAASWFSNLSSCQTLGNIGVLSARQLLKSHDMIPKDAHLLGRLVFPGDYVAADLVERIFRTSRAFNFFMGLNKESEIEEKGGTLSCIQLPLQEMRQHKAQMCRELFGHPTVKQLDTRQRVALAKALFRKYNCSVKQIARLCCLPLDALAGLH